MIKLDRYEILSEMENRNITFARALTYIIPFTEHKTEDIYIEKFEDSRGAKQILTDFDVNENHEVGEVGDFEVDDFFDTESKNYNISVDSRILADKSYIGLMYGTGSEETGLYHVFTKNETDSKAFDKVGIAVSENMYHSLMDRETEITGFDFLCAVVNGHWMFHKTDENRTYMNLAEFSLVKNLFSRNSGLFESSEMLEKYAVVVGCGSVGSLVAMELARAGVKKFALIDGDILKIHNVCRHQLGFRDLGRYKTDRVKDAILNINPLAEVRVYKGMLKDVPVDFFKEYDCNGIVVGTADNRRGNRLANMLAEKMGAAFVAIGCWSRAHAGEVFYWAPDKEGITYRQAFSKMITDERPDSHNEYFGSGDEMELVNFEPGTGNDLSFVTNVGIKVCLDLLNRNSKNYTLRVLDYFTNYTLVCNTNKPDIGGENRKIFPHPCYISDNIYFKEKNE